MDFLNILKIIGIVLLVLFFVYCVFRAIKQGFFPFLGCLFLVAIGFIAGVYFANKALFAEWLSKFLAWFIPLL